MTFVAIMTIALGTLLVISAIENVSIADTMRKWITG